MQVVFLLTFDAAHKLRVSSPCANLVKIIKKDFASGTNRVIVEQMDVIKPQTVR